MPPIELGQGGESSDLGDDKPWAAADTSDASPYKGRVYIVWWDNAGNGRRLIRFARTWDQGQTWFGHAFDIHEKIVIDGRIPELPGIEDGYSPQVFVDDFGSVYIIWLAGERLQQVKMAKSTDGGDTFSKTQVIADGITSLESAAPRDDDWAVLPNGLFRVGSGLTGCAGRGSTILVAWSDYREGRARIYFKASDDSGSTWDAHKNGVPLLDPAVASADDVHDFFPQLAREPRGYIACAFYEYTPGIEIIFQERKASSGGTIEVILALSEDTANTFQDRVKVTDRPWDPSIDAPFSHGDPNVQFIGDYFGLAASPLGFFPLWTDTRTGIQELFTSRISLMPTSVNIHWSGGEDPKHTLVRPSVVVRRQPDGDASFVTETPLTNHTNYVYAMVTNGGNWLARNVRLAVTVTHSTLDVRYPQDFYSADWDSPMGRHAFKESMPVDILSGETKLLGPVEWFSSFIPLGSWTPMLLIEARCDNDDSNGGNEGACVPAIDPSSCPYSSSPDNYANIVIISERYESGPVPAGLFQVPEQSWWSRVVPPISDGMDGTSIIWIPFQVGNTNSKARLVEVLVDKGLLTQKVPMAIELLGRSFADSRENRRRLSPEWELIDGGRVVWHAHGQTRGEMFAAPGTRLRANWREEDAVRDERAWGARRLSNKSFELIRRFANIELGVEPGEVVRMALEVRLPEGFDHKGLFVRISQRNDRSSIIGTLTVPIGLP